MEIPVLKKLYDEKYGRIPDDADDRLHFLISSFKSNKWEEQFLPFIQHIAKLKWKKENHCWSTCISICKQHKSEQYFIFAMNTLIR